LGQTSGDGFIKPRVYGVAGLRVGGLREIRLIRLIGLIGLIRLIRQIGLLAGPHSHKVTRSHNHVPFVASPPLVPGVPLVPSGKPATIRRQAPAACRQEEMTV
jgi:hypothetical protein